MSTFVQLLSDPILSLRLLNTIRQGDYYLITEDFDSCTYAFLPWICCLFIFPFHPYRYPGPFNGR